ncbi:S1 RNA-binding domain-containing protein [Candidatus Uhrbacteria bacterium]|nr:S1 RNA-binding domain-containing protein [Candidatus Uhrbacteria bacterium]
MEPTAQQQTVSQGMADLLKSPSMRPIPKVGDIIQGRIITLGKNEVQLDIEGLTTGVVRGPELYDESGEYGDLKIGEMVGATVIDLENENGEMELSFLHAGHKRAWEKLLELQKAGTVVSAKVVGANKGGLLMKVANSAGFLPVSQLTPEHYPRVDGGDKGKILEKLQKFVNQSFDVKIIDVHEQDEKLIVSEKAAWEDKQRATISQYKIGDTLTGKVTGLVDFGAFVELPNGLEGLIHISEIAWQRLDHPRDVLTVGQEITAQIIVIEGSRISLSLKKMTADPWVHVLERYAVGQIVKGKVLKVNPFGLFVELDPEIHGLAHVSELAHTPVDPTTLAKPGDTIDLKIISIEPNEHRLGLSLKAMTGGEATPPAAEVKPEPEPTPAPTPEAQPTAETA